MSPDDAPAERILKLAAYAHERAGQRSSITLEAIVADVPGYGTPAGGLVAGTAEWERVRKLLQRDVKDLREHWGIELTFDAADDEYRLAPPCFTAGERRALLAAAAAVAVEGLTSDVPGALGTAVDDTETQIVIRVHELVAVLRDAIGAAQAVTFTYDGTVREVEPYAIGTWRNRWYLAGHDRARGELRRFRLDRVASPRAAMPAIRPHGPSGAYTVPGDFDSEAAFDLDPNVWGTDPCVRARVVVDRDHLPAFLAEFTGSKLSASGTTDDAWNSTPDRRVVELEVREHGSFRTRLLAFRGNAVVVAPPELVAVVRDHLRALADG